MFISLISIAIFTSFSKCIKGVQCPDDSPDFCYDSGAAGTSCYDDKVKYCACTETATLGVGSGADVKWNDSTGSCDSDAREGCLEYKENLRAFYKGTCYSEQACKDAGLSWIQDGSHPASCTDFQTRQYVCEKLDHTEWDSINKACICEDHGAEFHGDHCHGGDHDEEATVSSAKKWGYGIIASSIISLFAIFGVMVVLLRHKWWYQYVLSTMVALAMGCLLSDAILHLIPLALGLHNHGEEEEHGEHEEHDDHEEHEEGNSATQQRNITVAITLGIYIFLLFEKAIHFLVPHQHSHGGEIHENTSIATEMKQVEGSAKKEVTDNYEELEDTKPKCDRKRSILDHLHEEDVITRDGSLCSVDTVAWMVIFGDAVHNFADGLVMGAAFSSSLATGLATSIAVFCHEVPHELGDFAVLLNAGMKIKFAVLFNFLSACTCFLGLFVGLAIGENESAQKWIFALTAGMFIYISCADLIPEMHKECEKSKNPLLCFGLQQIGLIFGFLIMYFIALYEEDLMKMGGGEHNH